MRLLRVSRWRGVFTAVCACTALLAWLAAPALALGGSDPAFPHSLLAIDAGGPFIQGEPFEMFATGLNEPVAGSSGLVPYELYVYLLPAKVATCPTSQIVMLKLIKKFPTQIVTVFNTPVPEAGIGPTLDGPFTTPLFEASAGNFTGSLFICGYSVYGTGLDAAWYSFGPVTIKPRLPASAFPSNHVTLGTTSGCWPVASTKRLRGQGLIGVAHPARPMVFTFGPAGPHNLGMFDVPAPLNAVWIGPAQTVIGGFHGTPHSKKTYKSPSPVTGAVFYPVGWRVPAVGARLRVGASCSSTAGL